MSGILQVGDFVVRDITHCQIGGVRAPHGKVVGRSELTGLLIVETKEVGRTTYFVDSTPTPNGKYKDPYRYQFVKVTKEQLDSGELIPGAETERALM
jgi:hypothetical protein